MATQEIVKAKVKFVTSKNGEVTAVLTDHPYNHALTTCYSHIGQHGGCDAGWVKAQRKSTPEEYADLLAELTSIGYDVAIVK
jgi:hypothetical protein